jgi:acetoacetate decarboxylase
MREKEVFEQAFAMLLTSPSYPPELMQFSSTAFRTFPWRSGGSQVVFCTRRHMAVAKTDP